MAEILRDIGKPWLESPLVTKGAGSGNLPVDASFVRGIITSREKISRSGMSVGEEIAENCDSLLHLHEGQTLADLGCGPGLISTHLTDKLGPTGWLYCLDASELMLSESTRVLFGKRTTLIHGDIHVADKLVPEKVDAAILSGNVHLLSNRRLAFESIKRMLKPEGKLVLVCHAYFHKDSRQGNFFSNSIDRQRETRKPASVDGLRLPMLSEKELNEVIGTINRVGLSVNSYEKDSSAPDVDMVFGYPPERTVAHRLGFTHQGFSENVRLSVAKGILSDVYRGRPAQVYLLCTKPRRFTSTPNLNL